MKYQEGVIRLPPSFLILIFTFVVSTPFSIVKAKRIIEKDKEEEFSPQRKRCLQEVFSNPITKTMYPNILNNFEMLTQLNKFCACKVTFTSSTDKLAQSFVDRKKLYEHADKCSLKHLSKEIHQLYYAVTFANQFYPQINYSLERYYPQSVRQLASVNSYNSRSQCLKEKVRSRCSKVKSLRLTFTCIQEFTRNHQDIESLGSECPDFQSRDNELAPEEVDESFI